MDFDILDNLAFVVLAVVSAAGVAVALLLPLIQGEAQQEKRLGKIGARPSAPVVAAAASRQGERKKVEDTLKMMEERQKSLTRPTLPVRLEQAGLSITVQRFYMLSGAAGVFGAMIGLVTSGSPLVVLGLAFAMGLGVPQWLLGFLKKRRMNAFTEELPNAVDVIVRGVKAGLPPSDCMRVIASEAKEPLRSEFRMVMDQALLGVPLSDAVLKLHERVPTAEANFFGIVMSIQSRSGGSLADTLANLSKVLRERKKMRAKIQAMSQEAKSSAAIIGSLPFAVTGMIYMTAPDYITLMFTTHTGNMLLAACLFWMGCGVFVMRQMINFDF